MTYVVVELQTNDEGQVANLVTQHATREEAESKYHAVLSAAAVSSVAYHAAVLMTNTGHVHETKCYHHEKPEPEGDAD